MSAEAVIQELYQFLLDETNDVGGMVFETLYESNTIIYKICVMIQTLVTTKQAYQKQIIQLTKQLAEYQRKELVFNASLSTPSAATSSPSYLVRTTACTNADKALVTVIDKAQTVYDLLLPFETYKKLVKLLLVAEHNLKRSTSRMSRPHVHLFWHQINESKQFIQMFFSGSLVRANNWFSGLMMRTMIKSKAAHRLLDNTTDLYDDTFDTINTIDQEAPPTITTPVSQKILSMDVDDENQQERLTKDLISFFRLADSLLPGLLFKNRKRIQNEFMCTLIDDISSEYTRRVNLNGGHLIDTKFDDYTEGGTVFKKSPGVYLSSVVVFTLVKFNTDHFDKLRQLILSPLDVRVCSSERIHTIMAHGDLWSAFAMDMDIRRELFFISIKLAQLFSPDGPTNVNNNAVPMTTNNNTENNVVLGVNIHYDYLKKIINKEGAAGQTPRRYDTFMLSYVDPSMRADTPFVIELALRNIFNVYDQDLKRSFQPFLSDLNDVNYKSHVSRFLNSVSEKYFLSGFPAAIHPLLVASKDKQIEMEEILSMNNLVKINTTNDLLLDHAQVSKMLHLAIRLERDNTTPNDMDQIRAISTKALIAMLVQAQLIQVHTKSVFGPSNRTHWHNYPDNFAFVNK
ncbi:hypothetical protein WDU94_012442 [Cyamophila willieti]